MGLEERKFIKVPIAMFYSSDSHSRFLVFSMVSKKNKWEPTQDWQLFILLRKDVKNNKQPPINNNNYFIKKELKKRTISYLKGSSLTEIYWCLWKIHFSVRIFSFFWEPLESLPQIHKNQRMKISKLSL